jgi:hypothetical protein
MSLRVIITAALAALLCGTAGAARLSQPLDIELAIDTTGSMGQSIKRIQRDAAKLVTDLRARFPGPASRSSSSRTRRTRPSTKCCSR